MFESGRDVNKDPTKLEQKTRQNPSLIEGGKKKDRWILALLFAPDEDLGDPIYGEMHLMLSLFFMEQKLLDSGFDDLGFEFESDFMGPVDEDVYDRVDELVEKGHIDRKPSEEHHSSKKGSKFQLTDSGKDMGRKVYEDLGEEHQQLLSQIKRFQSEISLSRYISYLYSNYPSMFDGLVTDSEQS